MLRPFYLALGMALLAQGAPSPPAPVSIPPVGQFYLDPATGRRVWTVTDSRLCPAGARHYYSYWPVWSADGQYLVVDCLGGRGRGPRTLLLRDEGLKVVGDALRGAPPGLSGARVFWSWVQPHLLYGTHRNEIWTIDPVQRKAKSISRVESLRVGRLEPHAMRLAYVSFDDRYALLELQGLNPRRAGRPRPNRFEVIALLTLDLHTGAVVGTLDLTGFEFYDEAVFTKDNSIWLEAGENKDLHSSYRYSLDFSSRIRVAESGHHAHGILPDGSPVAVKAGSNRDCPRGSPSGNPRARDYPEKGWKPTAILMDPTVDTTGTTRNAPLASELFKLGCQVPGAHHFGHFSWNNTQRDSFYISTLSYSGFDTDPLAYAIVRVQLRFNAAGKVDGDTIEVLAHHRSDDKGGYWAQPRVSCNQQGTRCLFASTMSVATDAPDRRSHLYVVDVAPSAPPHTP